MSIPVIIPAYEPDDRLFRLLDDMKECGIKDVIVVDDGSGSKYKELFLKVRDALNSLDGVLLVHEENKGKGRALKTAFEYVLENYQDAIGVVTADSDGQHTTSCINKVKSSLESNRDSLILGVRTFDGDGVPWKSKMGNTITLKVMKYTTGISVSDTQTGLRGIPKQFMQELLSVKGERFEFETRMLVESYPKYSIVEVPIETIYDSKDNHQTHFNPWIDSIKIYKIFFERFLKYIVSSLSSFAVDILIFTLLCRMLKKIGSFDNTYITISTVVARCISSLHNYLVNKVFVFSNKSKNISTAPKYFALVIVQMLCSAILVTIGCKLFVGTNESIVKVIVDTILFLVSYKIQKRYVFANE